MIDPYTLWGITLGTVCVVIYILVKRKKAELSEGVVLFLACAGIAAGVKVCKIALDPALPLNGDRLYVFLGGIAVIWVSGQTILERFKSDSS